MAGLHIFCNTDETLRVLTNGSNTLIFILIIFCTLIPTLPQVCALDQASTPTLRPLGRNTDKYL